MKTCTKCNISKDLNEFHCQKNGKFGKKSQCIVCVKEYKEANKDIIKKYQFEYKKENSEYVAKIKHEWYVNNKDKVNKKAAKYAKKRYKEDVVFKLKVLLRSRLSNALNKKLKTGSAVSDLGCSIEELKRHLETQFEPWMNWDNHGPYDINRKTWHIDHIKALANFDLTNKEEFKKACHYSNLKPKLAIDNLRKQDKNE